MADEKAPDEPQPGQMDRRQFTKVAGLFSGVAAAVLGGVKVAAAVEAPVPVAPPVPVPLPTVLTPAETLVTPGALQRAATELGYGAAGSPIEKMGPVLGGDGQPLEFVKELAVPTESPTGLRGHPSSQPWDGGPWPAPAAREAARRAKETTLSRYRDHDPRKGLWDRLDEDQQAELALKMATGRGMPSRGVNQSGRVAQSQRYREQLRAQADLSESMAASLTARGVEEHGSLGKRVSAALRGEGELEIVLDDTSENRAQWARVENRLGGLHRDKRPRPVWRRWGEEV